MQFSQITVKLSNSSAIDYFSCSFFGFREMKLEHCGSLLELLSLLKFYILGIWSRKHLDCRTNNLIPSPSTQAWRAPHRALGGSWGEEGVDCLGIWKLSGFYMIRHKYIYIYIYINKNKNKKTKNMKVLYSLFIPKLIDYNLLCFDPIWWSLVLIQGWAWCS